MKRIFIVVLSVVLIVICASVVFAAENDTEIIPIWKFEQGDVNLDTKVNIKDATLIQKYLAKLSALNDQQLELSDVDGKEGVSIKDATHLQKWLAGLVDELYKTQTAPPEMTTVSESFPETSSTENISEIGTVTKSEAEVDITTEAENSGEGLATDPTELPAETTAIMTKPAVETATSCSDVATETYVTSVATDPAEEITTEVLKTSAPAAETEITEAKTVATSDVFESDKPIELPFVPKN